MTINGKKNNPLSEQDVKDAIRAKKLDCKAWVQNKTEPFLHSRYAEARKSAALTVKKSKM